MCTIKAIFAQSFLALLLISLLAACTNGQQATSSSSQDSAYQALTAKVRKEAKAEEDRMGDFVDSVERVGHERSKDPAGSQTMTQIDECAEHCTTEPCLSRVLAYHHIDADDFRIDTMDANLIPAPSGPVDPDKVSKAVAGEECTGSLYIYKGRSTYLFNNKSNRDIFHRRGYEVIYEVALMRAVFSQPGLTVKLFRFYHVYHTTSRALNDIIFRVDLTNAAGQPVVQFYDLSTD